MTSTFSAWRIARYGGPERLTPVTVPMPTPGPGGILIRIHASAVTRADGMMRAGRPRFARAFLGLRRPRRNLSGTGLSGGATAQDGCVVLSTERMRDITVDPATRTADLGGALGTRAFADTLCTWISEPT